MACTRCGSTTPADARFCPRCGQDLEGRNPYASPVLEQVAAERPAATTTAEGPKPTTNLVLSIIVTLCCCQPLGIAGIVFAAMAESKWRAGDGDGARQNAKLAGTFSWIGFGLGILIYVVVFGLQIAGVALDR